MEAYQPQPGLDARKCMMMACVERAEAAYVGARQSGVADPVVLILDLRDPTARSVVEAMDGRHCAASVVDECRATGAIPTCTTAVARDDVLRFLRLSHPRVAEGLDPTRLPPGHFSTVVIGDGATSYAAYPIPAGDDDDVADDVSDAEHFRLLADVVIRGNLFGPLFPAYIDGFQRDTGKEPPAEVRRFARYLARVGRDWTAAKVAHELRLAASALDDAQADGPDGTDVDPQ